MNRLPRWRPRLALLVGIWGLAAAGSFTPTRYTDPVRTAILDALGPGRIAAVTVTEKCRETFERFRPVQTDDKLAAALAQVEALQAQRRQELAEYISQIQQASAEATVGPPLASTKAYEPLLAAGLVPARILGRDPDVLRLRFERILSRGTSSAIAVDDLVLANLPHLDQGTDAGIAAGQPAISGRVVVGCIAKAGRWTSTLQLVTDPDYRGSAQLVRQSRNRAVLGATGVIQGNGDGTCRMELVPAGAPVAIGDFVYSRQQDADQPAPVYYGRVIAAEPGADDWSITVAPAFDPAQLADVQVLNLSLNPERTTDDTLPAQVVMDGTTTQ
jgi:cell shape-determining protein MreC